MTHLQKPANHTPDFEQMLAVLRRERPDRPVLYEIFMNNTLYNDYCGSTAGLDWSDSKKSAAGIVRAFENLGYDYANIWGLYSFGFPNAGHHKDSTISLNEGSMITDRASFERYAWPTADLSQFIPDRDLCAMLPKGMKLIPLGPGGVLENVISITGFDNLCMMLMMDPDLARDIFNEVGSRMLRLYEIMVTYKSVGAVVSNDDWGFKTQTMISPDHMRQYVFPWHKKIARIAHDAGKPVILHSCGYPCDIMEDIIEDIGFDGKHSYEDTIVPVEQAYDRWGSRVATLGGLDIDFLCRSTPAQVHARAHAMLERTKSKGGYALGSGNSIPEYIPRESYLAMVSAAWEA